MTTAFPLLSLPDEALALVVGCMKYTEIVLFSLASNKTKEVVKSLNLSVKHVSVTIEDIIRILFDTDDDSPSSMVWSFYPREDNAGHKPIPVYMPARVSVASVRGMVTERNLKEYQNPGLSVQEWVNHMQFIFSCSEIEFLLFENETCQFDWISLKNVFGKIDIDTLFFNELCSLKCAQLAVRHFPSARCVTAFCSSFNDPSRYRNILIQNLDSLVLGFKDMSLKIGLDDLLLINSKEISIRSPTLTNKMVNQFLKHWIEGSNPRMENARFRFVNNQVVTKETILKGLQYQGMPLDDVNVNGQNTEVYYIFRRDGTAGMISIERDEQENVVHFNIF
ncbi:hypothetical protein GCK72_022381 [Caenorhabditis remanei]|uniref:F-box domain-containing protein n=1 Tax=Caenorhabditis remanei TaxID=31234 RepID=A0A6A5FTR0_CAERE|nr:hypothetical protein GCK72_022381 [Caenorhabditis remanei]KAF1745933.1 hypothetical protein GCK72_022381 [Caenorhabditis remanei]